MALNQPIVGMAAAPSGSGYWLVAFDGGIFAFGDAPFAGSLAGCELRWVTGMQASPTGAGYWITSAEGRVAAFGDAHHHGWPFTTNTPPLAMAVLP
ncbi:MAG: hypothetical protein M5U14_12450 [Acidimicrobiia bacterium]|nr:hypothetical protein [Acidimicrobiia bacterium]